MASSSIIKPSTSGAQNLGAVKTPFIPTPYQKLNVPVMEDGGLGTVSKGFSAAAKAAAQAQELDDTRLLGSAEADMKAWLLNEQQTLEHLTPAEQLTRIDAPSPNLIPGDIATDSVMRHLSDQTAKYMGGLSGAGKEALAEVRRLLALDHRITLNGIRKKAKTSEDLRIITHKIAGHTVTATSAIGTPQETIKIRTALSSINTDVRDKRMGLAKLKGLTTENQILSLVKLQQAQFLGDYIAELLGRDQGKGVEIQKAIALADEHLKEGGILSGTKTGRDVAASIVGPKQTERARVDWDKILSNADGNVVAALKKVAEIKNTVHQDAVRSQASKWSSIASSIRTAHVQEAGSQLASLLFGESPKSFDDPEVQRHARIFLGSSPQGLVSWMNLQRSIPVASGALAQDKDWVVNQKGGTHTIDTVFTAYKTMATDKPGEFIALMNTPAGQALMRSFTTRTDYAVLQKSFRDAKSKLQDITENRTSPFNLSDLLKDVGFTPDKSNFSKLTQDPDLQDAITEVRKKVWETTGKIATKNDLRQVIAEQLMYVIDEEPFPDKKSPYTLSALEDEEGLDITEIPLESKTKNFKILALYFNTEEQDIREVERWISERNQVFNLKNTAQSLNDLGKPNLGIRQGAFSASVSQYDDLVEQSIQSGYPFEILQQHLKSENKRVTSANIGQAIGHFNANRTAYEKALEKYMNSEDEN